MIVKYNDLVFDFENMTYWCPHRDTSVLGKIKCIDGKIMALDGRWVNGSMVFNKPETWVEFDDGDDYELQEL